MSLCTDLPRRALRPALSLRYQYLHRPRTFPRAYSTAPPPRRSRLPYILSVGGLMLGLGGGYALVHTVSPPSMPEVGTHEDQVLMEDLNKRIEEEFKVKVLRGKCLGVTKALQGKEAGWVEIVTPADGSQEGKTELVKELQGAKGLGVERNFWDRGEQKLVGIVWFGGSLSGWPGVTHGGLLATALQEKVALADTLSHPSSTRSHTSAAKPQRLPGTGDHAKMLYPTEIPSEPAQLSIDYIKPTYANHFYTVRVVPSYDDENVKIPIKGAEWIATLETMDGKVCVKAAAKFAPRSRAERVAEGVVAGRDQGSVLRELREWLWPSRQRETLGG